jgi:hypothetical protein
MKYIKEFESNKNNYFWKVRVDQPYLEASLIKLNVPRITIDLFLSNDNIKNKEKVYVSPGFSKNEYLSWNRIDNGRDFYKMWEYVYKGEIKLTLEEANMIIMASKYNI